MPVLKVCTILSVAHNELRDSRSCGRHCAVQGICELHSRNITHDIVEHHGYAARKILSRAFALVPAFIDDSHSGTDIGVGLKISLERSETGIRRLEAHRYLLTEHLQLSREGADTQCRRHCSLVEAQLLLLRCRSDGHRRGSAVTVSQVSGQMEAVLSLASPQVVAIHGKAVARRRLVRRRVLLELVAILNHILERDDPLVPAVLPTCVHTRLAITVQFAMHRHSVHRGETLERSFHTGSGDVIRKLVRCLTLERHRESTVGAVALSGHERDNLNVRDTSEVPCRHNRFVDGGTAHTTVERGRRIPLYNVLRDRLATVMGGAVPFNLQRVVGTCLHAHIEGLVRHLSRGGSSSGRRVQNSTCTEGVDRSHRGT